MARVTGRHEFFTAGCLVGLFLVGRALRNQYEFVILTEGLPTQSAIQLHQVNHMTLLNGAFGACL
jgi:hypothetical protein